jgi:hypothetical protein
MVKNHSAASRAKKDCEFDLLAFIGHDDQHCFDADPDPFPSLTQVL